MAISARGLLGSATAITAGTTIVVTNTTGAAIPVGTLIHITGGWDNINVVTAPTVTCSTIGGATAIANHATAIGSGVTTTAGAGVWHQCFRAVTTADIAVGGTIATLTSNQSAVKRAAHAEGFAGALTALRGTVTTGVSAGGTPTVTTTGTALVVGDLVIGSVTFENATQMAADTDTTGGDWSAIVGVVSAGGGAQTNVGTGSQYKVLNATGTQTYNPTAGVADTVACVYSVQPDPLYVPQWTARTSGVAARNGTAAHTIPTPNGASTPAGAFLMIVVAGGVTHSTTASGWTERLQPVSSGELSVFTKDSATAGEAGLALTHNGSNYLVVYESFQFPAGTTYVAGASTNSAGTSTPWSALTGLTSVEFYYAAVFNDVNASGSATGATSWSGIGMVELTDFITPFVGNDGGYLSTAYAENLGVTSWTPASSSTRTIGIANDWERVWLGLSVPPPVTGGTGLSAGAFDFAGSATGVAPGLVFTFPTGDTDWTYSITTGTASFDPGKPGLGLGLLFGLTEDAQVVGAGFNMPAAGAGLQGRAELWSGTPPTSQMALGGYQTFVTGWNELPLTPTAVTTGTDYWIVVRQPAGDVRYWAKASAFVSGNPEFSVGPAFIAAGETGGSWYCYDATTMTAGTFGQVNSWYGVTLLVRRPIAAGTGTGASSGGITWVGAAAGKRAPKATVAGAFTFVGASAGKRAPKATVAGAFTFVGASAGKRTPKATVAGAFTFVGAAAGQRTPKATSTGAMAWAGTSAGKRTPKAAVVGAFTFVGAAAGTSPVVGVKTGSAAGAITWAGTSVGKRTPKATSTGAFSFVGAAVGKRTPKATVVGGVSLVGAATGYRPVVGANTGISTGGISWAGTGVGKRVPKAAPTGAITWVGTTAGVRASRGTGTGAITWATVSVGRRTPKASSTGAVNYVGSATGKRIPKTIVTGAVKFTGAATGFAPSVPMKFGSAAGSFTWVGAATGQAGGAVDITVTVGAAHRYRLAVGGGDTRDLLVGTASGYHLTAGDGETGRLSIGTAFGNPLTVGQGRT